jgi:protein O-GlcNAc transferase
MTEALLAQIEERLRAGDASEALAQCNAALARGPASDLFRLRGRAHLLNGDSASARADFEAGLALSPEDTRLIANLGQLAFNAGDFVGAAQRYREVLALDRHNLRATRGLALTLAKLDQPDEALQRLRDALERAPGDLETRLALAQLLLNQKRPRDVLALFPSLEPEGANAELRSLRALGAAHFDLEQWERASHLLARAVARDGGATDSGAREARVRLAVCHSERYELSLAREVVGDAVIHGPGDVELGAVRAMTHFHAGEIGKAVELGRRLVAAGGPHVQRLNQSLLFYLSHDERVSAGELRAAHEGWATALRAAPSARPRLAPLSSRPLKIGYLSPDFREHVVMRFLEPLLDRHATHGMTAHLLSTAHHEDRVSQRLCSRFAQTELTDLSLAQARARIRELELDVVVDLVGHSSLGGLELLADRVAPLTASYLGYPSTTGLATIDLRISDEQCDPPETQANFSERLSYLGRCAWVYQPQGPLPELARVDGPPTFGCFNRVCKWSDTQLELFAAVLQAVPDAKLLLKARGTQDPLVRERVLRRLAAYGVEQRVELRDWSPSYQHALSDYRQVDLTLDTFPYAGTTTTCDSLLMGVPVVSLFGEQPASRVGRSLLSAVGLAEYAVVSKQAYVDKAVQAMGQREQLAAERPAQRDRLLQGPLGNADGFVRALRALFDRELSALTG